MICYSCFSCFSCFRENISPKRVKPTVTASNMPMSMFNFTLSPPCFHVIGRNLSLFLHQSISALTSSCCCSKHLIHLFCTHVHLTLRLSRANLPWPDCLNVRRRVALPGRQVKSTILTKSPLKAWINRDVRGHLKIWT